MSLTAKDVAEILKALEASSFDTLELELNGVKLQLRRSGAPVAVRAAPAAPAPAASSPPATHAHAPPVEVPPGTTPVPAPLLGIFYRAPKPGEPPYVEVGARVETDSIVGIIEVMKLMNTVRAGVRGTVTEILAADGTLVEYDQTILRIRKSG